MEMARGEIRDPKAGEAGSALEAQAELALRWGANAGTCARR